MTVVTATGPELQQALRDAAADVIIERGLGSFSLREVARRAGVSHAAPGYHFGDMSGLLTSLAAEGFERLYHAAAAARDEFDDPVDRLTAIGRAYVGVGLDFPAHLDVMFRPDLLVADDPDLSERGMLAFSLLEDTVQEIAERFRPSLDVRLASQLCWSAMQGLIQVHPKLVLLDDVQERPPATMDELVAGFTAMIVSGMLGS